MFFKIRPSQEILKIRDGTPFEAEKILTYIKSLRNGSVCYFSSKLDVPSNIVQKKRVARIMFFKIRPSQEILKIRDGTPLEEEGILTYIKSPRNGSICYFSSKLDVPSNVVHNKRVARILFFKIRASQEILKIRDGTPLEAEGILTYIKSPRNGSICYFSSKLDVPSNVVQKKRVARILFFKIRSSQEILKIRDATPLEVEGILTYIKSPRNGSICYFSSKLDVPSNYKPSQVILKNRDGTPLEAEEILTYIKSLQNGLVCYFSSKLDVPSNVLQKKRVARILFFKIRPSQEILKIRDGTPFEAEEMLTYIKEHSKQIEILKIRDGTPFEKRVARILFFKIRPSQEILKIRDATPLELDVHSNVVYRKRVARILFFKIRPSQVILKNRDGTPLEAEEILTYIKSLQNGLVCYFSSKLDVPSNVLQKKRVARILFFKIRPSQEILKIRDGTPFEAEEMLTYIKEHSKQIGLPSQEILKIRDGTPFEMPSQEILKIRDGTPLEAEGILTYIKALETDRFVTFLAKILKIRDATPLEAISRNLKIRDGTPLEAEGILTYIKSPRNGSICYFSSKLDVPSNVVQKKRVAQLHFFKIRPSQEILKIRDATPLEAEGILTYIKSPRNGSICYFSSNNIVQKKRVARIMFFKIRPSQEILKIRDGTPLEAEGILTYIKSPRNGSICYFSSKLDVPSNVVQKKRVARILFFKIRPSQEILKIRDATPLEVEGILTYIKSPRNGSICYFSSKLDVPSN
ncbi:hypothetical protein OROMI_024960 [Orobanche minor]